MANLSILPIYVVSLARDTGRRDQMHRRFGDVWNDFNIFDAVDAQRLPLDQPHPCRSYRRRPLVPGEIACALSHLEIWRQFLASGASACIIFEDDIEGDTEALKQAEMLIRSLPDGAFALLGGQEGLRNRRFVYGQPIEGNDLRYFRLHRLGHRFLARTCCYGLTQKAAAKLLRHQEECLGRADHWLRLLSDVQPVYFAQLFSHPIDLASSRIEVERRQSSQIGILRKIWADGILYTLTTVVIKVVLPLIAQWRPSGLERVMDNSAN